MATAAAPISACSVVVRSAAPAPSTTAGNVIPTWDAAPASLVFGSYCHQAGIRRVARQRECAEAGVGPCARRDSEVVMASRRPGRVWKDRGRDPVRIRAARRCRGTNSRLRGSPTPDLGNARMQGGQIVRVDVCLSSVRSYVPKRAPSRIARVLPAAARLRLQAFCKHRCRCRRARPEGQRGPLTTIRVDVEVCAARGSAGSSSPSWPAARERRAARPSCRSSLLCLCGLLVTLVFTGIPLVTAWRTTVSSGLSSAGRGTTTARSGRSRGTLIGLELAASLTLIAGAALMAETAIRMLRVDFGIDGDDVVTASLAMRQRSFPDEVSRAAFFDRLLSVLEELREHHRGAWRLVAASGVAATAGAL